MLTVKEGGRKSSCKARMGTLTFDRRFDRRGNIDRKEGISLCKGK